MYISSRAISQSYSQRSFRISPIPYASVRSSSTFISSMLFLDYGFICFRMRRRCLLIRFITLRAVPVAITLQRLENELGLGRHKVRPRLPQRMNDEVNKSNLSKTKRNCFTLEKRKDANCAQRSYL